MRHGFRYGIVLSGLLIGVSPAWAAKNDAAPAAPQAAAGEPAMDEAMAKMLALGSPGEAHKALEPFVGSWTYTAEFLMAPDAAPETMTGTSDVTLLYGGRFLKQTVTGASASMPPFEGMGLTGYDNIRQEYQSVWLDDMGTGIMVATGSYDPATKTLVQSGDFSCPMTGEAHRKYRSAWMVVDTDHTTYTSWTTTPDGQEFRSMTIRYTRATSPNPCPQGMDRC